MWVPGSNNRLKNTAPIPLKTSSIAVATPAQIPAARMAFVPPVLPLSTERMSFPVDNLTMITPNGIDPIKYANNKTPILDIISIRSYFPLESFANH
jgi:hypothetical protein